MSKKQKKLKEINEQIESIINALETKMFLIGIDITKNEYTNDLKSDTELFI
jgi:hypothetical protein